MWLTARSGPGRLSVLPDPLEGLKTSRLHFNAGVLVRGVQNQMDSLLFHPQQSNSSIQSAENSSCAGCCAAGVPGALIKLGNPLQMLFLWSCNDFLIVSVCDKKTARLTSFHHISSNDNNNNNNNKTALQEGQIWRTVVFKYCWASLRGRWPFDPLQ